MMLKDLFEEQHKYLDYFYERLDPESAQKFFQACLDCQGLIVLTGVGKSGLIAEKIAMTLISTGTRALYLPPTNFLHGDLGILTEQDILILISKSGETEELLNLVPFVKKRGAKLLAIVSNPASRLAKESTLNVCLPVEKELCPFDLAPTTSTAVQLIFGDVLAVALMKAKEFSIDAYALNHPSGTIGKKVTLTVQDLMWQGDKIPLCRPEDRLLDKLVELSNKKCGCLLIADKEQKLLGIFTDGDLRRSLQRQGASILEQKLEELMSPCAIWVSKDLLAWEAMKRMQKDPKRFVMISPVLEQEKVVGIIRMHDIVQAGLS